MSKVVNTKFGSRGLVYLPPVKLDGNKSPQVKTIVPVDWSPPKPAKRTQPDTPSSVTTKATEMAAPPPQQNQGYWYGGNPQPYATAPPQAQPMAAPQLQPPVYGPGNMVPVPGQLDQLTQQANIPSMQVYSYGQYPQVGGNPVQYMPVAQPQPQPMQPVQQPMPMVQPQPVQPMMMPPQPQYGQMMPNQMYQQQQQRPPMPQAQGQYSQGNEKHIFYGPDGKVLPGPPPGFAFEGSEPRDPRDFPKDFGMEGMLDYGRLRSVNALDNSKRIPRVPDFLHKELLLHYKQFKKCHVRIVARDGDIHVTATPYIDQEPAPPPAVGAAPGVEYEYVPVYLDDDDKIIGRADDRDPTIIDDDRYRGRTGRSFVRDAPVRDRIPVGQPREFYHQPVRDGDIPIIDGPISHRGDPIITDRLPITDRESVYDRTANRSPHSPRSRYFTSGRRTDFDGDRPRRIDRPGTNY